MPAERRSLVRLAVLVAALALVVVLVARLGGDAGDAASRAARDDGLTGAERTGALAGSSDADLIADDADDAGDAAPPLADEAAATDEASRREPVGEAAADDGEPTATVRATVLLERSGEPRAGANVHVMVAQPNSARAMSIEHERTDDDGRCELVVPANRAFALQVGASVPRADATVGFARVDVEPLRAGETRDVELRLPHGADVACFGRVVAEEDDRPLRGARVARDRREGPDFAMLPSDDEDAVESDADGLFRIDVASWKPMPVFSVMLDGYGPALLQPDLSHADPAAPMRVALQRSAHLVARVTGPGAAGSLRVATDGYQLALPSGAYLRADDPTWIAPLDRGRAELALPPRVPLRVELILGDAEPRRFDDVTLAPGETREIELALGGGARLTGRLVDQHGAACGDVELWLAAYALAGDPREGGRAHLYSGDDDRVRATATTGADGRFGFDDVAAGAYWVGPKPPRFPGAAGPESLAHLATAVVIPPDETRVEVELVAPRGLWIQGRVLDPFGEPASGESVRARSGELGGFVSARSDRDGAFTLGPLALASYTVASSSTKYAEADPVTAFAGATDVVLRLREAGGLRGIVVDAATGAPLASQTCVSLGDTPRVLGSTQSDGAFEHRGLEPGVYTIAAATGSGLAGVARGVEVHAGDDGSDAPARVELAPGARVTVLYVGPSTYANFVVFANDVPVDNDGLHTGTTAEAVVPAGRVRVELRTRAGLEDVRELDLAAGEAGTVEFRFE